MKHYVVTLFIRTEVVVEAANEKEAEEQAFNMARTENNPVLIEAFVSEA